MSSAIAMEGVPYIKGEDWRDRTPTKEEQERLERRRKQIKK